jgi:thiol:disulfide interchange protein DsbD
VVAVSFAQDADFLKPDEAFQIAGHAKGADSVVVEWRIADGYYLYRSKFRFKADAPGFDLGYPDFPEAKTKDDEFFGKVEIYRDQVTVEIPVRREPGAQDTLPLLATSQGCADQGLCYPPHTQTLFLELPPLAAAAPAEPAASPEQAVQGLAALGDELGLADDGILPPDQAFRFTASSEDGESLRAYWQIAEGTYLYRDKLSIRLKDAEGIELGAYDLPPGKVEEDGVRPDGSLGPVAVYHDEVELDIPLIRTAPGETEVLVEAKYQGCADRGICYPPVTREMRVVLPRIDAASSAAAGPEPATEPSAPAAMNPAETSLPAGAQPEAAAPVTEQDKLAEQLADGSLWAVAALFFVLGLGLAFTPCVFPMIPILSGIIAGQGATITSRKAFVLSVVYVLAMAVTYTTAGVLAALFGQNLQAAFQNPWILSAFAAVFVLLALSMFGFYELQLPSRFQSKLSEMSNRQEGGSLVGVGIMGFLSALIVGPCVAPPLAAALIYIGQTGDAVLGGSALFALSMGMGAPLIAIGTSAGKLLPRAGAWMDTVKAVFGVLMLAVAVYLLERVVPSAVAMALWGLLMVVSAIYMGALKDLPGEATGWARLWKGLGVALLIYGALMLVGAAAGGRDTVQPLRGIAFGGAVAEQPHLSFRRIKTVEDLDSQVAAAVDQGRPVMLDFYADWCTYCIQYEKYVFSDPDVVQTLDRFMLLQADVTANDAQDRALLGRFGVPAPPAIIFYGPQGEEKRRYRVLGYMDAEAFAAHARQAVGP